MESDMVLAMLHALADKTRFTILQWMAKGAIATCCDRIAAFENGCCVADVVAVTGLAQPTVSHHLKVLEKAGLVHKEPRGPWTCYFPNPQAIDALLTTLRAELYPKNDAESNGSSCC
ncbi:ArsR/SmtB family transcription factor [Alicyclobacillus cellulosilyticus]|nr:metalloregulator ArsR/SmtB family transcription factor [Alicyclobacillus cellulosilyticus]